jgi:hypothetical protein
MSSPDWRIQPLRNFWQAVNWENRPIAPISKSSNAHSNGHITTELSLLMSVREYFRAISWMGIPAIAVTTSEPKPVAIDDSNETLEDFLDDISKFF